MKDMELDKKSVASRKSIGVMHATIHPLLTLKENSKLQDSSNA